MTEGIRERQIDIRSGAWVPILESSQGGGAATLFALPFSAVGAALGYVLGRTFEPGA